jgi:outer membrane protein assembly factor BamB
MRSPRIPVILGLLLIAAAGPLATADDWPHWRGPSRNGVSRESSGWTGADWLPQQPVWTAQVGSGGSSPIVVDGRVYTLGWDADRDLLQCRDAANGKLLWSQEYAAPAYGRHATGDEGLYSGPSSTPEYDPTTGRLFTLSLDGDLHCWDLRSQPPGQRLWRRNLYNDYGPRQRPRIGRQGRRDYGYTTAPLAYGDWVLVEVGAADGAVMAFDQQTGERRWASHNRDEAGHTGGLAPLVVEGVPCAAVLTLRRLLVLRLDPRRAGETVAEFDWETDFANNIASPAVFGNSVLVTSGYNHEELVRLRISLTGAEPVWRRPVHSKICTPVIHDGRIYWAFEQVRCLDWETGDELWSGGSFGDAGSCIVTADGRLIVWSGQGRLSLIESAQRSARELRVLADRPNLSTTDAWPHVVLAHGRLYCRDRGGILQCFVLATSDSAGSAE